MIESEYKTPEELLEFILTECGDMKHYLNYVNVKYLHDKLVKKMVKHTTAKLDIKSNFDMEKVFYAINFLKEYFNMTVDYLVISDPHAEIEEGYLDKTEVSTLNVMEFVKLPKLPLTIRSVVYMNEAQEETYLLWIQELNGNIKLIVVDDDGDDERIRFNFDTIEEAIEKVRTYYD